MTTEPLQKFARPRQSRERASTLLAVFWVLAILSFAVVTTLAIVLTDVETESTRKQAFVARQLAEKGIAIAANPIVNRWDPLLHIENEFEETYDVRIESAATRINLNAALVRQDPGALLGLFSQGWGLSLDEAESLRDAMIDWIDSDDQPLPRGAENRDYANAGFPSLPLNRSFHSLDEVALVRGMELVEARYPDWRGDITLWSLSGGLDINEADARLIALVCGCSIEAAHVFVDIRSGADRIPGTGDDLRYASLDQVLPLLGLPSSANSDIGARITFDEPAVRIQSLAKVGDFRLLREIVMQRSESRPAIYHLSDQVLP